MPVKYNRVDLQQYENEYWRNMLLFDNNGIVDLLHFDLPKFLFAHYNYIKNIDLFLKWQI